MYEAAGAMDYGEGVALSQQLSQVCLRPVVEQHSGEELLASQNGSSGRLGVGVGVGDGAGVNLADQENPYDCIGSQDFFCTPDFVTPVEQKFSIDFDNKENSGCLRSPSTLTPLRVKRSRPDTIQTHPTWLDDSPPNQDYDTVPCLEIPAVTGDSRIALREKKKRLAIVLPPNSRGRLTSMRRRVQSPICLRNPFLEEDANLIRKLTTLARSSSPFCDQTGISNRYREDFHEIQEIGHGNFSRVFKVMKRIDGCLYAVKRSQHPLRLISERRQALTEVQALAAVGPHESVVRYYTAWFERDYCYIQTELCDGTLRQLRESDPGVCQETSLLEIMRQMASALSVIHSKGLVHLDLKPENIYVRNGVYKLGDFGRATRADGSLDIEEGDARYMPLEILNDDHSQLLKVDMFALGATIYELARGSPLPSSGPQFQALRQGKLTLLPGYSLSFQNLIKALMHPVASTRPSASDLLKHSIFRRDLTSSLASTTVADNCM